ncbi:MAG: hypothetical protein ACPLYD_15210, partial [Anaerolineae bacterium]
MAPARNIATTSIPARTRSSHFPFIVHLLNKIWQKWITWNELIGLFFSPTPYSHPLLLSTRHQRCDLLLPHRKAR